VTDGGGHAPDLTVAAFDEFEFDPAVGDILAKTDGRIARGDDRLGIEERDPAGTGAVILDGDTGSELLEGFRGGNPLDLGPVGAGMAAFGIEQAGIQAGFIAEEQQALGVGIESAEGVDVGWKTEPGEGTVGRTVGGELAEDTVRFVEGDQHVGRRAEQQGGREAGSVAVRLMGSMKELRVADGCRAESPFAGMANAGQHRTNDRFRSGD